METSQAETPSGKYASEATLVKRTEDLFSKSLPEFKTIVSTEAFLPSPASVVNAAWIDKKMREKGVRIKQMSQIVKAMFYFYLR